MSIEFFPLDSSYFVGIGDDVFNVDESVFGMFMVWLLGFYGIKDLV
jgi:hypothetical protein